ncbi:MAG: phytanoyl-CoA dioxygenase family protein [Pseudomonadota bacterium]
MVPVRAVAFDKSPSRNWSIPWHQDRIIAVRERADIPGFSNWSNKDGVWHCEPHESILNRMLFVRLHLDDADQDAGAMEVAVGSEIEGFVEASSARTVAERYDGHICTAARGDVLVLPMLALHRSLPATNPRRRRVLRIDYASHPLPAPLNYAN